MHRRHLLAVAPALAQTWPERQVTIISPFAPGQSPDVLARLLAPPLSAAWGKPVVVENVPGASGMLGVDRAVRAVPDGHTLVLSGDAALVVRPSMTPPPPYDSPRDLGPISIVARTRNMLLASNSLGVTDLAGLIALARARPGAISYGHTGVGFSTHLGMEALKQAAGLDITEVPYGNAALLMPDLIAGRIGLTVTSTPAAIDQVRAGQLRALAVTSRDRMPALADVPTIAESGFSGFEVVAWFGLLTGGRVPAAIISRIEDTLRPIMADPAMRARIDRMGLVPEGGSAAEFVALLPADIARMAAVLRPLGLHR